MSKDDRTEAFRLALVAAIEASGKPKKVIVADLNRLHLNASLQQLNHWMKKKIKGGDGGSLPGDDVETAAALEIVLNCDPGTLLRPLLMPQVKDGDEAAQVLREARARLLEAARDPQGEGAASPAGAAHKPVRRLQRGLKQAPEG